MLTVYRLGEKVSSMQLFLAKELIFRLFLSLHFFCILIKSQFNLYDTWQAAAEDNPLQFDCLYVYKQRNATVASNLDFLVTEINQYCLRPSGTIERSVDKNISHHREDFTFIELRRLNITTEQLLLWSASIDLAEQYQHYLNHPITSPLLNQTFFNCTQSRFGSHCQYSFVVGEVTTLSEILEAVRYAQWNFTDPHKVTNLTCYVHLKCDRGGPPMCLDWREVCDGRIDCLDGGLDEAHCFELEINECDEKQFRCANGLCVAEEYWIARAFDAVCGRRSCPLKRPFSCGNGQCVEDFDSCYNRRDLLLMQSVNAQGNLSYECWIAMTCLTKIIDAIDPTLCKQAFASSNLATYLQSCESLVQYPTIPILSGHVHFLYNTTVHRNLDGQWISSPDYVCYDETLCEFLTPTFRNGSSTCRYGYEMGFGENIAYDSWVSLIRSITPYFRGCLVRHVNRSYLQHSSVYACENSSKLISKHRIVDGVSDCHMNDDERQYNLSCSMNNTHRFECAQEDKCRSPFFWQETCSFQKLKDILFNEICDDVLQVSPETIDAKNHTDETECNHWPCNNQYTRCNTIHNCPNGEDEENCTASTCNSPSILCVDPYNYTLTCLSAYRINDYRIDCLGAMDEPQACEKPDTYSESFGWFRCWNTTICLRIWYLCDGIQHCPFGDDEKFCGNHRDICPKPQLVYQKSVESALCRLGRIEKIYFSLKSSLISPASIYESDTHIEKRLTKRDITVNDIDAEHIDSAWGWRCNDGIYALTSSLNNEVNYKCFCPPTHYGDQCQYQNQRIAIEMGFWLSDRNIMYSIVITLINDDERQEIHSHEQFILTATQYCGEIFMTDLLYATRPKNDTTKYSLRIDVFNKVSLAYIASWHFSIRFLFLPVTSLIPALNMPSHRVLHLSNCPVECHNGECFEYMNEKKFFCRCRPGWSGVRCQIPANCNDCSSESICVGQINNRSICVCPLGKFGPRCLLTYSCPPIFCMNNGRCIVLNPTFDSSSYTCVCPEPFGGSRCEREKARLVIHFNDMVLPSYLLAHIITVNEYQPPIQKVMFKKFMMLQQTVTLYVLEDFHMVFIDIAGHYYMIVLQQFKHPYLAIEVDATQRCIPIKELLDSTMMAWPRIRQVKYYHMLCQTHPDLQCFLDQLYMCLCTLERHANCFQFNSTSNLTCRDVTYCLNGGQCFQDNQVCPLDTLCICTDCYFGDRCQFYVKGIGLTLDDILRYQIRSNTTLRDQPISVKMSAIITMIMFVIGLINNILSFITFHSSESRQVGCGVYLLASSITSLLTIIMFTVKFWFLILTQINAFVSRSVLHGGCKSIEPLLKLMLYTDSWFNACVAVERAVTVFKGVNFSKSQSKRIARWIVTLLPIFIMISMIHEPLYRELFDDKEENRIWCVAMYPPSIQSYNTIILCFHFITPFFCNLFSALFIIFVAARHRAKSRTELSYREHLREQFTEHKQLIISPIILVVLSIPRILISLFSTCVKSSRNPWLYLSGYFISFIPSVVIFIAFVLPSNLYKKQFKDSFISWRQRFSRI